MTEINLENNTRKPIINSTLINNYYIQIVIDDTFYYFHSMIDETKFRVVFDTDFAYITDTYQKAVTLENKLQEWFKNIIKIINLILYQKELKIIHPNTYHQQFLFVLVIYIILLL